MTLQELLNQNFEGKNVLIIGCPASGKSHISGLLAEKQPNHTLFHSDDYMEHGYKEALYVLLEDLKKSDKATIVEGVQGYRLLRKGVELDTYYPDVVVQLHISQERMEETYRNERDEKKVKYLKQFNAMHDKILNDYFAMPNNKKPEWINLENEY